MSTEVEKELKRIGDDVKSMAEAAQKEIKAHAALSEETKAKVDQLLTQQGELRANLQNAEQKLAMLEHGGHEAERTKSIGEQFTSASGFEDWAKNPSARFRVQLGETGVLGVFASSTGTIRTTVCPELSPETVMVSSSFAAMEVARMPASAISRARSGDEAVAVTLKMTPSLEPLSETDPGVTFNSSATASATDLLSTSGR